MCSTPLNKSEVNLKFTLNQSKPNPKSTLNFNPKPNINTTVHQQKTNPKQFLNNKKQSKYLQPSRNKTCSSPGKFLFSTLIDTTLPLQLHYTTATTATTTALHHTTSSSCGKVTTATIATIAFTPKNTTPTTCRSISGFALPSVSHNNQSLL